MVFCTFMNYIYVNKGRHLYECLLTCLRKSIHQDFNYWYFSLSLTFFENINQDYNLLPYCMPLWSLLMYWYVKMYVRLLCLLSYYWQYFVQINAKWKLPVQLSTFVNGRRKLNAVYSDVALGLHLNATYAQQLALKSVYEKSQYIMRGKLFFSRTVFELAQGL